MIRSPVWVSIEGVNGVGKTHLARLLSARLGAQAQLVSELTDDGDDPVIRDVVSALSVGRSFLRTGQPLTETLALLALKVREYERVTMMPTPPPVVIEDRGVDTVACYQAPILADVIDGAEPSTDCRRLAEFIYATAASWRPLPHRTVLLLDDPEVCARRYTAREHRLLNDDEQALIAAADALYQWRAEREPDRFRILDRRSRSVDDVFNELHRLIIDASANATADSGDHAALGRDPFRHNAREAGDPR